MSDLDSILADLSPEEAWRHLEWMNAHARARTSGSPDQERAASYFLERLTDYGLEADLETFTAYRSMPLRGTFRVLAPGGAEIPCETCGHIRSTPDAGVEGDLIFVGEGGPEHYSDREVRGKIALAQISHTPPRTEKARIAAEHGAAAIVFMNWGPLEHQTIPRGAIKSVWGNPTRAMMPDIPQIPAVGIPRAGGEELRRQLQTGPVRVRVVAQASRDWGPLVQPQARLRVDNPTGDFIVVGGHHDAWEPGMTDNAAGNAAILELARVFSRNRNALRRDVVFALWNGHEIGDYEGSTWFVDRHWDDLDAHGAAYFNVDSVGMIHTSSFVGDSSPELKRFHLQVEQRVLGVATGHRHLTRDNEHPFFGVGLPALEGRFHFSREQVAAWDNASGGWWWHSFADTLDKIDRQRFEQTVQVYAGYIWEICTSRVLPMDFVAVGDRIAESVSAMQAIAGDQLSLDLPVDALREAAGRLERVVRETRRGSDQERASRVDGTLKRLSRILMPAFETVGGRYTQDRCALDGLNAPVPALHELQRFATSPPDGEVRHLLFTELLRERNRLSDALRRATEAIEALVDSA